MRYRMFAGSDRLIRFIFRRDRVRLSLWIVLFCGTVVALSPMFETLFTSPAERVMMAQMLQNPAMVAIIGPVYGLDHYHTGAMFSGTMLLFSAMIIGIMNIFLITRHTRQDEETGRLEVIRSLPVGRLSVPGAALAAALLADAAIALVTGFGLYLARADGMTLQGCLLFGLSVGAVGFFFAAATALICQLTANNRTAMGLAFALMVTLYLMRAVGDIRSEPLSLASPLGLILRTQAFVADRWWPVGIVLGIAAVAALLSLYLAGIRDLGRGLVAQRPGRPHASRGLNSALGLAVRLVRASALIWLLAALILAAMYGSVFGDLEAFMQGNELMQMIFAVQPDFSLAGSLLRC